MNIQSRLKEAQIALSESMEGKVPMQFEINKLSRERDSLQGRLKLLEDEVSSKTQQLVALNAHLTSSNTNFETRLNNESNNNKELSIRITSLQGIIFILSFITIHNLYLSLLIEKLSNQDLRIEEYSKKIKELEEESAKTLITTKQEIDSLKKLCNTYKKHHDEVFYIFINYIIVIKSIY